MSASAHTYIFFGPPGSGKGTQSDLLAAKLNIPQIDVGSVLRQRAAVADEFGRHLAAVMQSGQAVEEAHVQKVLKPLLTKTSQKGIIIDGYCRTEEQVSHIDELWHGGTLPEPLLIKINIDPILTLKRIEKRRNCRDCGEVQYLTSSVPTTCRHCGGLLVKRPDDSPEIFLERVKTYHRLSEPAAAAAKKLFTTIEINGDQPIDAVASDIWQAIKNGVN